MKKLNMRIMTAAMAAAMTLSAAGAVCADTSGDVTAETVGAGLSASEFAVSPASGAQRTASNVKDNGTIYISNPVASGSIIEYVILEDGTKHALQRKRIYGVNTGTSGTSDYVLYYKFRAPSTGLLAVTSHGTATLLNSSRKAVSKSNFVNMQSSTKTSRRLYYGVRGGSTYYLKVKGSGDYYSDYKTFINYFAYDVKSYSHSAGNSRGGERALRVGGKKYFDTITYNGGAKYFKYTTSKKHPKLHVDFATCGTMKARVSYTYNGRTHSRTLTGNRYGNHYLRISNPSGRRITYHVKAYRVGKSSGVFRTYMK